MIKDVEYKPYTYILRHVSSGRLYIGSKTAKSTYIKANPQSLLERYFTSSNIVKQIIKTQGPSSFEVVQIFECESGIDALKLEDKLLQQVPENQRDLYFNRKFSADSFKRTNSGKITINNGVKNRYISASEAIPEGWVKGRKIHPNTSKSLTRRVSFNGKTYDAVKDLQNELGVCLKTVYNMIDRDQVKYA